jgi:hypothetical protein
MSQTRQGDVRRAENIFTKFTGVDLKMNKTAKNTGDKSLENLRKVDI